MNFYQEHALSFSDSLLYKISNLEQKNIPNYLKEICKKIEIKLSVRRGEIEDDRDYKSFRMLLSYLDELIDIFSKTSPDVSSTWALPLIEECYLKLGLEIEKRKVLLIHTADSKSYAVHPDILAEINLHIETHETIDIFIIPSEARYDIASISLIAHEVGHIFLNRNKDIFLNFIKVNLAGELQKFYTGDLFQGTDIDLYKKVLPAHIEEYLCDYIGRLLLGPSFDFAFLKLFCNSEYESTGVSSTHPPINNRINNSIDNLNEIIQLSNGVLKKALEELSSYFVKVNNSINPFIKIAEDIANRFILEIIKIEKSLTINELNNSITLVFPELDAFRPPFETVSINEPILINPIQIIIGSTLYFNGKKYLETNEFFKQSSLSVEEKYNILRRRITEHIRYAISLYSFLKYSKNRVKFSDLKEDLSSTIWSLREKKTAGKSEPSVVIVPTISPKIQYSSNSVDLRLGPVFLVNKLSKYTHIQPDKIKGDVPIESYYDEYYVGINEEFTLHPHQFILAQTLEYISIPPDFYALVLGRSTWGRLGLNIATATSVGSGFRGCITLELRNLGETPLILKVGVRVCQISLIKIPIVNSPAGYYANSSKYIGPTIPEVPKIRGDSDWDLLKGFLS